MKHKVHGQRYAHPYIFLDIELLPASQQEQDAINNVRDMDASQEEKDIVENYLLFNLNAISIEWQKGNKVLLKSSAV